MYGQLKLPRRLPFYDKRVLLNQKLKKPLNVLVKVVLLLLLLLLLQQLQFQLQYDHR